jgi:hypothetical protein
MFFPKHTSHFHPNKNSPSALCWLNNSKKGKQKEKNKISGLPLSPNYESL